MKKRTEINIEIEELMVVRAGHADRDQIECPVCHSGVMVTQEQAAAIASVSVRTINGWVETDRVHFVETAAGLLLVCVNSLKGHVGQTAVSY